MFLLPIRDSIAVLLGQSNILRLGYRFKFDVREFVSEQFYFAFTCFGPPALDFNKCSIGKLEGPAPAEVRKANQAWMRSKWYQILVKRLRECQVSTFDLTANNWGIRPATGQLVILDLGF